LGRYIHCIKELDVSLPVWPDTSIIVLNQKIMVNVNGLTRTIYEAQIIGKKFVRSKSVTE
jgi:hypothetical protein